MRWKWVFLVCLVAGWGEVYALEVKSADCLACHGEPGVTKDVDGKPISVFVDEKSFDGSTHGSMNCVDCHADVKGYPHDPAPSKPSCATCHAEAEESYRTSLHAVALREARAQGAACLDCHGPAHAILPVADPKSVVHRTNIPSTCGRCHGVKFVMEPAGIDTRPFFSYQESVHGKAVAAGSEKAAGCTDCHGSHDIRSAADPRSPIFKFAVPDTCGRCHPAIAQVFSQSIHGKAVRRGNWHAPVCTDCHGIHLIKPHIDPTSSVAAQALARSTCAQCHESLRLSQEFGLPEKRASSYLDSYHGMASSLGSTAVANCASCHGIHDILPSSDPRSAVHKSNLAATCGKCHPGAGENFARGVVHGPSAASADTGGVVSGWVRLGYLWLIAVTIGFMLIHNVLALRSSSRPTRPPGDRAIVRMNRNQRVQHLLLLASFSILVWTGFALKYPDSWLAWSLGTSETVRRIVHRIAAVVMMGLGVYHAGYMLFTREGRQGLKDFFPTRKDAVDLWWNLLYFVGASPTRAAFGRFGYPEKMEYWAVIWGTVIMGTTGLLAWFSVGATRFLPRWSIDVALTVHFYEAILATMAIVVWHFYHVMLDPEIYPMNWAWWDGLVSSEWHEREHPLAPLPPGAPGGTPMEAPEEPPPDSAEAEVAEEKKVDPDSLDGGNAGGSNPP